MSPVEALAASASPALAAWMRDHDVEGLAVAAIGTYVDALDRKISKLGSLDSTMLNTERGRRDYLHTQRFLRELATERVPPDVAAMFGQRWVGEARYVMTIDWQKAPAGSIYRWVLDTRLQRVAADNARAEAARRAQAEAERPARELEAKRDAIRNLRPSRKAALFAELAKNGLSPDFAYEVLLASDPNIRKGSFEHRVAFGARFVAKNRDRDFISRVPLLDRDVPKQNPAGSARWVYAVELDHPDGPALYVGQTGLDPEARFERHREGGMYASDVVHHYGRRLRPERLGPFRSIPEAEAAERKLAQTLRASGLKVFGGH